jgi:hypothetical protein
VSQALVIPLTPEPQTFFVQLGAGTYRLRLSWCSASACWLLDVEDRLLAPLVSGLPMVTGVNLLAAFAYLGIPGALVVQSRSSVNFVPTFTSLGTDGLLFFLPTP